MRNQALDELSFARWVSLLGAILYPAWGYICLLVIPDAHERLAERFVIGGICLAAWGGSFLSPRLARSLPAFLYVIYALITGHYLYIVHSQDFLPMYVIGTFIAVGAINACFSRIPPFLLYSLAVLVGATLIIPGTDQGRTLGPFLVLGLLTQQILVYVSLHARRKALDRLHAAQSVLERRNQELREADRYKDEFLAIISHELRTPLNAIIGLGSVLDDEVAGQLSEPQNHYLSKILEAGDVLLRLVSDLLDMSRIQAGKFTLDLRPVSLEEETHRVLAALEPIAQRDGHRLKNAVPEDLPPVTADPGRVDQVLTNLVGNAIKFSPAGSEVVVSAIRRPDALEVAVQDHGDGISTEDLPKLFKPFSQVDSSATRKIGGAGLGLSICKALVEAHGGQITVESTPQQGSIFRFTLPIAAGPEESPAPPSDAGAPAPSRG